MEESDRAMYPNGRLKFEGHFLRDVKHEIARVGMRRIDARSPVANTRS
jgi:hypothetical protein